MSVKLPADATHWTTSTTITDPVSNALTYPYGTSAKDSPHHTHRGSTSPRTGGAGSARLWRTTSPHSTPAVPQASRMRSLLAKKKKKHKALRRNQSHHGRSKSAHLPPSHQFSRAASAEQFTTAGGYYAASPSPVRLGTAPAGPRVRPRPRRVFKEGGVAAAFYEDLDVPPTPAGGGAAGFAAGEGDAPQQLSARRLEPMSARRAPRLSAGSARALGLVERRNMQVDALRHGPDATPTQAPMQRRRLSTPGKSGGLVGAAVVEAQRSQPPPLRPASPVLHALTEYTQPAAAANPRAASPKRGRTSPDRLRRMMADERRKLAVREEDGVETPAQKLVRARSLRRIQSLGELQHLMDSPRADEPVAVDPFGPEAQQIHDTMLAEWLESYNEEQAAFSSAAIAAEVKLRRAEVFTQHMPKPNPLLTAIAFEVLDLVGGLFGRYNGLMRRVRDVIFQSVYTDDLETVRDRAMERRIMGAARPHTARAGGRLEVADDEGYDKLGVDEYYECRPFYSLSVALKEEQKRLEQQTKELQKRMKAMGQEHEAAQKKQTKKLGITSLWKSAATESKQKKEVEGLVNEIEKAGQTVAQLAHRNVVLETVHDNTVETIKTFFGRLTHPMRKTTLCALLDEHTTTWQGVMKHMLKTVSPAMLSDLVVKTMMGKPDYTTGDIMKLVNRIMVSEQSATLAERPPSRQGVTPGSPVDMLLKLMDQLSAEDREVFLKELFLLMPPEQRQKGFESIVTALAEAAAAGEGPSTTQLMHQMMETVATATAKAEADAIAERGGAQQSGEDSQQAAAAHAQAQSAALVSSLLQATGAGMPPGEALAAMMRTPHFRDILRTLDADARAELIALLKAEHQAALQDEVQRAEARLVAGGEVSDADRELLQRYKPQALARVAGGGAGAAADAGTSAHDDDSMDWDHPAALGMRHRRIQCNMGGGGGLAELLAKDADDGDAATPRPRRKKIKRDLPWSKYLKVPKRRMKKIPKLKLATALLLMYDCFEKKIQADRTSRRVQALSGSDSGAIPSFQPLGEFISDHLFHKFGLASLRDNYLYGLVACIGKESRKSSRVKLFGTLCGVVDPDRYSSRLCDMFLALVKGLFPKFTSNTLRVRKEGEAYIKLAKVVPVVAAVFVDEPVAFALDKLQLSDGRRTELYNKLQELATPYGEVEALVSSAKDKEAHEAEGGIAGKSHHGIPGDTMMISFDAVVDACMQAWYDQTQADTAALKEMYVAFDTDKNGVLSFDEYEVLIRECMPQDEQMSPQQVLRLFHMIRSIDGADDDSDQVSPEAFSMMCPTHGITPNYPAGSGSIPGCPGFPTSRSRPGSASSTRATPRAGAGSGPSYSRPRLRSSPDPTSHVSFDGSEGVAPTSARTSVTGGDADAVTVDGDEELGV